MEDFFYAGGIRALLAELAGRSRPRLPHRQRPDAGREHRRCRGLQPRGDPDAGPTRSPRRRPRSSTATSRPQGAVIKPSAADPRFLKHTGPALAFESYDEMTAAINDADLDVTPDHVLVLKNAGPVGAGMPEWGMLPLPVKLLKQGVREMMRISDARMSGTSYGACILHVSPEAAVGGPLALVRTGDLIEVDVEARQLNLLVERGRAAAPPRRVAAQAASRRAATAACSCSTSARRTRAATSTSCSAPSRCPSPRSTEPSRTEPMDLPINSFKRAIKSGRQQIGLWSSLANNVTRRDPGRLPGSTGCCSTASIPPTSRRWCYSQLQAATGGTAHPIVRPPWNDAVMIKRLLDVGTQSFLIPYVQTRRGGRAGRRRRALSAARHAWLRVRLARVALRPDQGLPYAAARRSCACWSRSRPRRAWTISRRSPRSTGSTGCSSARATCPLPWAISATPGHPDVQHVIDSTIDRIKACGKAPGILTGDVTLARRYIERGCLFTAVGADVGILVRGCRAARRRRSSSRGKAAAAEGGRRAELRGQSDHALQRARLHRPLRGGRRRRLRGGRVPVPLSLQEGAPGR